MAPSPPRFVLLDNPIPNTDRPISNMLGRFVVDYTSPLDNSAPRNLPAFLTEYTYHHTETSVSLLLSTSTNNTLHSKLMQILSLTSSTDTTRSRELTSEVIKPYRLREHDQVFDRLGDLPDVKSETEALFYRPGQRIRQVYMIVGLKAIADAKSKIERGGSSKHEVGTHVPIGAAGMVAAGLPPIGGGSIGAEWKQDASSTALIEAEQVGEQIFAVEYRVVKKRLLAGWRGGRRIEMGGVKRFGWGEGTMADDSESEDEDDDDNEDENEDEDEDEDEEDDEKLPQIGKSDVKRLGRFTIQ
ncbi:hypothetical protein BJ875DRAFT_231792 [Amylocarpus encephaloides]|uniref:Uncharacterized protein n=1 Tax=Amylocarpus encephaloides TaxID=45428 RepID=A0A9P7Y8B2_9HELO|nr:hypothetical protein BJ875DRAFT_231792 [Amylocarpus encephaloides]